MVLPKRSSNVTRRPIPLCPVTVHPETPPHRFPFGRGGEHERKAPRGKDGDKQITANVAGILKSPTISGSPNEIIGVYIASVDAADMKNTQAVDDSGVMSNPWPEYQ